MRKLSILAATAVLFMGCGSLSPTYVKQEKVGQNSEMFKDKSTKEYSAYKWWEEYKDPYVNNLVETMLIENQDISIYQKNIKINLLNYKLDKNFIYPQLSLKNEMTLEKNVLQTNKYGINMSSYEIDYLGKVQEKMNMDNADIMIATYNLEGLKTLSSYDLISGYSRVNSLSKQIVMVEERITNMNKLKEILNEKIKIGLSNSISMIDIDEALNIEMRKLHTYKILRNNSEKDLKTVLGKDIDLTYHDLKEFELNEDEISTDVIQNRFDIQVAEKLLIKQNASIGIVKSQYFPTLSLSAFLGIRQSGNLIGTTSAGNLFGPMSSFWSVTPSIMFNVFDIVNGNIERQVNKQRLEKEKALNNYVKTVRSAFMDVKVNVLNYRDKKQEVALLDRTAALSEDKYKIAEGRLEIGLMNAYDVLIEKNMMLDNKLNLEQANNEKFIAGLNVRKALSGKI
jgi:multidrug efflux system outer membrane protein